MSLKDYKKEKQEFIKAAHKAAALNLMKCSSGNLSCRVDDDVVLLSKTGSWLSEITEEEISVCTISGGEILNKVKPTVENIFHRGILKNRPEMNVVLHFQSPNATTIACSSVKYFNFNIIAEIPLYIGEVGIVPYLVPGSPKLAEAVIEAGKKNGLIIMKSHGLVTMGKDFNDAIQKACFFELACDILFRSGGQVNYLKEDDIKELEKFYKKKR